jgi:putative DNA methylase
VAQKEMHMTDTLDNDLRLIEAGFPCHQVGAETLRERDTGKAPPTHRLHVWWARRPLTPSRAAILGATLPVDADVDAFLRALGIAKPVAEIPGGGQWTLVNDTMLRRIKWDDDGIYGKLNVDATVQRHFAKEVERRVKSIELYRQIQELHPRLEQHDMFVEATKDNAKLSIAELDLGDVLNIKKVPGNPALAKARLIFKKENKLGSDLSWSDEDIYGYPRAFTSTAPSVQTPLTILDPTSGGGSIPFEALRLGHNVIANELNPVAMVILHATLNYPRKFGVKLVDEIKSWGQRLVSNLESIADCFAFGQRLCSSQRAEHPEMSAEETEFCNVEHIVDYLYCRQVTCPHCDGQAPLLNSLWLSKEDGDKWAVRLTVVSETRVDIEPYRITGSLNKEQTDELDAGTVDSGRGTCPHCKQMIDGDAIKAQGRGESPHGKMEDRLFCVVAVRFQPKLKKNGSVDCYATGDRKGKIKTKKVRFFRAPIQRDLDALKLAEKRLAEKWDHLEKLDLIPTELFPDGNDMRPRTYGMPRWCDIFTPRQLLGHLTLMETLQRLKPEIIETLGPERGRAVITYLQFAIDKGVDYNSRQTRWIYQRGQVSGTFGRHDFSFKWTFGEMVFSGPNSGAAWGLSQILNAYSGMALLMANTTNDTSCQLINGSGAQMSSVESESVDLVVNDPPYYNNVMYSELSDYFYVWQKRSLRDLYPGLMDAYLTDKQSEAVANPYRDGSANSAKQQYETLMREMYAECHRVTKPNGRMVLMFTHKSQAGWETLTQALIDSGWVITATYPVDSEFGRSMHIMDNASAESSIFLVCRKRQAGDGEPGTWRTFGGKGVQQRIVEEVEKGLGEFERLKLRPVDTMVASYGRALRILSEKWPVMDGDEPVSPIRAINEASRVVAQNHIRKLTQGRLKVEDLTPEAAMAVTLYGICGLGNIRFDEVLNISRSLGIAIESRPAGYNVEERSIGYATEATGRRASRNADVIGYHAPLVRKKSNLRLAKPEERNAKRLAAPQHEWDILQGMIVKFRQGDIPVARAYLNEHADIAQSKILDLLRVWTNEADDDKQREEGETMLFGLA